MNSILYAANIGTLAAWLSVSGASTVGMLVPPPPQHLPELKKHELPTFVFTDGEFMEVDMFAGGSAATSEVDMHDNQEMVHAPEAATPEVVDIPDAPEVVETEPLPDVPDLPEEKPELKPSQDTFAVAKKSAPAPKASVKRSENRRPGSDRPIAKRTESGSGSGSGSGSNTGAGAGTAGKDRMSGGRTPKPPYPSMARKNNIEGVVKVSITFGEGGEVTGCSILSASNPALSDPSILSTIRKWKKPGFRGTHSVPIRFTLN